MFVGAAVAKTALLLAAWRLSKTTAITAALFLSVNVSVAIFVHTQKSVDNQVFFKNV